MIGGAGSCLQRQLFVAPHPGRREKGNLFVTYGLSKNFAFMFSKFLIEAKLSQSCVILIKPAIVCEYHWR